MTTATTQQVRKYELMVIISGELTEKEQEHEVAEVKKILAEHTRNIFHEESWGRRDLSYKIRRQGRGYYVIFDFEAVPESVKELSMNVKLHPTILRHMIVALADQYQPNSYREIILQKLQQQQSRKPTEVKRDVPAEAVRQPSVDGAPPQQQSAPLESEIEAQAKLKKVEKKLEQILENPDIDVR